MPLPTALEICQTDLFTKKDDLIEKYPEPVVQRIMRVREMYNWFLANPEAPDKRFVDECVARHDISKTAAYSDLNIVKTLLPAISKNSRDFHRWRANEMFLKTFQLAEQRKDTKTMERVASSYARNNRVDLEDEQAIPYDKIMLQPFTATDDPRVLGLEPIPNIDRKIQDMIAKYRAETIDIDDVDFEEVDLELPTLLPSESNEAPTDY